MSKPYTERAFEDAIEHCLITLAGYIKGNAEDYEKTFAIDTKLLFSFLKAGQPDEWNKLSSLHREEIEAKILFRLEKEMQNRGTLDVIRNGFTDNGITFKLAFFKPETSFNPITRNLYDQNILSVSRQVYYSTKNENSVDFVLFLNGIPVATAELKNQFTKQSTYNAKRQFIEDRDPKETLFKFNRGALVHFAVDTDEVYITTKLEGNKTVFLPFNLGYDEGAGNPPNPNGYKTSYLWEDIWQKDTWLDIIGRFVHLGKNETISNGKKTVKESIIFPRYHQLDVVKKLSAHAREHETGNNYLIQHSAGSGKSNSIAWLAYRLFSLHNNDNEKIFHSVVVITDRKVLDKQLQDTIFQFDHKHGVVQKIDQNSRQLRDALINGNSIIITTLQKFPFILESIEKLAEDEGISKKESLIKIAKNRYAVIVDEAHSSQGGEAAKQMKEILGDATDKEKEDFTSEDMIRQSMLARGKQGNMSFFAFTATPKSKTLEVFGVPGPDGKPHPFHLYSMKQAIEENFIIDVLKNYTTYKTFYKLNQQAEDRTVIKKKASRAVARFMSLHPYNLSQKTEVMVEHFRQIVSPKIGGKAKAMVVTGSRLHAVRYYFEFKKYIEQNKYPNIKPLVAFSGKLTDPDTGRDWTEEQINGIKEKELPARFATDDYQLLLVADKYQTGFDQPLLHTMYVDKKLSGVQAVQTLSRLNRIHPGKEDTFVLDFANEEEDIRTSFQPYYRLTTVTEVSDPNRLYDLKHTIEKAQIIWQTETENFCREYFKTTDLHKNKIHALLNAYIDPAVDRFNHMDTEEEQEDFKNAVTQFVRSYSFLSQIIPFQDIELEKFFAYTKLLLNKLPRKLLSDRFKLGRDEVNLEYYRIQKTSEGRIVLEDTKEYGLTPATEAGMRMDKDEKTQLSEIIKNINERFGTEFSISDKLFLDQVGLDLQNDETIIKQAQTNTFENFKKGKLEDLFYEKLINRMDLNDETTNKLLNNKDLATAIIFEYLAKGIFERINI
jgi:type I restriction enzyme R subunit